LPEGKSPSDLAPNLAMAKFRLKPDWVVTWIIDPQTIQPGTRMPQFFPDLKDPSPFSSEFDSSATEQIKAVRDYVFSIGKQNP